mmetsp:Transcript_1670/g.2848  ORF Transcript_1670/g.2848 Transcript_1670/m.2848 type:complete len:226 (+) Transcript_1670:127-804(+)
MNDWEETGFHDPTTSDHYVADHTSIHKKFLMDAFHGDELAILNWLNQGANIQSCNEDGYTALMFAACHGRVALVWLLLDRGASTEAIDRSRRTALARAAIWGQVGVAKLLIQRDANLEAMDRRGVTPIMHAAVNGQEAVVDLFLSHDANINRQDYQGNSCLMWICAHSSRVDGTREKNVRMLLTKNIDVSIRNLNNETALDIARRLRRTELVAILEEHIAATHPH